MAVFQEDFLSNELLKVFIVCHSHNQRHMRRKASLEYSTRALSTLMGIGSSPNTVCPRNIVLDLPSRDIPESNGDDESRRFPLLYLREWRSIASAFLVVGKCCCSRL